MVKSGSKINKKTPKKIELIEKESDTEIWLPYPNIEYEYYEISNTGCVRDQMGKMQKKYLKDGYPACILYKTNGKINGKKIHRLVAELFVHNPNPAKYIVVNHIDGNKKNSNSSNLEWVTRSENVQHAVDNGFIKITKRRVGRFDDDGNLLEEYESLDVAKQKTGIDDGAIAKVCKGTYVGRKHAGGFVWKFLDENPNENPNINLDEFRQVENFPHYYVSPKGQVYSTYTTKLMKFQKKREGGCSVQLSKAKPGGGQIKSDQLIHRLVAQYFLKKPENRFNSVRHKDKNKFNNNVENLEWCYIPGIQELESKYEEPEEKPKKKKKQVVEI